MYCNTRIATGGSAHEPPSSYCCKDWELAILQQGRLLREYLYLSNSECYIKLLSGHMDVAINEL
jgi:hypothetical protein